MQDIAHEMGIHRVHLSRFKAGDAGFSVETLEKLAKALGLKISIEKKKRA